MSRDEISPVPLQRVENGLSAPIMIQEADPLRFRIGESEAKTRELAGFVGDRFFAPAQAPDEFRQNFYPERPQRSNPPDSGGSDGDDDVEEDDDDVDDEDDHDVIKHGDSRASVDYSNSNSNHANTKNGAGGDGVNCGAVTIAEPESTVFFSQYLQSSETAKKDVDGDNCSMLSRRKEPSSRESLRTILADPVTGALMDDAMILPCGHSFGAGGVEQVKRMKACCTCSQPVSEDSIMPNLSLRVAVQAFKREEDFQANRSSKRRRDQDWQSLGDPSGTEHPRSRSIQFPFAVADRVIIKGNKRTPPRFVGREAVVTTQCLNGWYVVKTLDNAESVKLQYRSLAKVPQNSSLKTTDKMLANWL